MSDAVQKSKRTGRPRGFVQEQVVTAARDLFWDKGLNATSYEDLTAATGLHRPSIHSAFGDKRGLFHAALSNYLSDSAEMLSSALSRPTLSEALSVFFETDLAVFLTAKTGRGCYALGVAAEAGRGDPELAMIERAAWQGLQDAIVSRLARAADDEIPFGLDRAVTADLILATHVALANRARAGESADELRARLARFIRMFTHQASRSKTA